MQSPENDLDSPANTAASLRDLEQANRVLRGQLMAMLIALFVLSVGVNLFIFKQLSLVHRQATDNYRTLTDFSEKAVPEMNKFLNALKQYAQTDTNFVPVLLRLFPPTNAPAAGATSPPPSQTR